MTPFQRLGPLLENLEGAYPQWSARCPAHEDKKNSLSLREQPDGTVLVCCHTGCRTEDVVHKLGLEFSDLFVSNSQDATGETFYDYVGADGKLQYQVVRRPGKRFIQRRPNGSGEWIYNLKGVRRVLYGLPDVLAAVGQETLIYITEGEKDTEVLRKLGLVATTNSGGAGKWRDEYSLFLANADVVILPDCDTPGGKHALDVARSLYGTARSIRIINLPGLAEKGDVSDWLGSGHTRQDLQELVRSTPTWSSENDIPNAIPDPILKNRENGLNDTVGDIPNSYPLSNQESRNREPERLWEGDEPAPMQFAVGDFLPLQFITIMSGDSGLGKSYTALYLAICVTLGKEFFGRATIKTNVLWVDCELNHDELKRRSYQVARGVGLSRPPEGLFYYRPLSPLGSDETDTIVREIVKKYDIGLIIVDSLSVGSSGLDMKEQRDTVQLLKQIEQWGTVLAIDHTTKAGAAGNQSDATIYGSTFKRAIARSALKLTRADGGALTLRHDKSNFGKEQESVHFAMEFSGNPLTVTLGGVDESDPRMAGANRHMSAKEKTFYELVQIWQEKKLPVSITELTNARGVGESAIRNDITNLGDRVEKLGNSTYRPVIARGNEDDDTTFLIPDSIGIRNQESEFMGGEIVQTSDGTGVVVEAVPAGSTQIPVRLNNGMGTELFDPGQLAFISGGASQ